MEERIPVAIAVVMMMMMMMSGTVCEERRQTWPDLFTPVHRVSRYIYLLICRENPFVSGPIYFLTSVISLRFPKIIL